MSKSSGETIRVEKASGDYAQIKNGALRDRRLSWKARGVLAYLLSLPDNWVIYLRQLERESDEDGREKVRTALKELERYGYLTREKVRDESGRLVGIRSTLREKPHSGANTPESSYPTSDKPNTDKPKSDNRPLLITIEKKTQDNLPAAREESRTEKPADPLRNPFVKDFCERWGQRWGAKYPFAGGKDGAAVKRILDYIRSLEDSAGHELEIASAILDRYFADDSKFIATDNRHSLAILASKLNAYVTGATVAPKRRAALDSDGERRRARLNGEARHLGDISRVVASIPLPDLPALISEFKAWTGRPHARDPDPTTNHAFRQWLFEKYSKENA